MEQTGAEEMSTAERVGRYLERRAYLRYALADEVINFSALARRLQDEIDGSFEAIKVALRRQGQELSGVREGREDVAAVLDGSTVSITGGLAVVKADDRPDPSQEPLVEARTEHGWTAVVPGDAVPEEGAVLADQALVTVTSPESLEQTPGVLAYLLSLLGAHGINATEVVSCREDTHIVVGQADATAVFELLSARIG